MANFTVSQITVFIGIMAFIVSVVTEALKKLAWFEKKVPTALVVICLSLIRARPACSGWRHIMGLLLNGSWF